MTLHGARPDAHELGRARDGSSSFNEGGEDFHVALRRGT
jgi:hypothetical protein